MPEPEQRQVVHDVIYQELCQGKILEASREAYLKVITSLRDRGAQAIVLGCTEIALLVQQEHTAVPLYDTTEIHAAEAVKLALAV